MNNDYQLLTEKEDIWAGMLEQVLKDNGVDCVSIPMLGAAVTLKAGARERYQIFVPKHKLQEAEELLNELFSDAELPVAPEDREEEDE